MTLFPDWRQRFIDRFEPRDGDFAYREDVHARAVTVTAEERDWLIRDYDERRSIFWAFLLLDPFVAASAGFLVQSVDANMTAVAVAVHGTFFFVYPISLAVWADAGRRALLRGRPSGDGGLPKAEVERRRIGQLSWAGIVGNVSLAAAWLVAIVRDGDEAVVWRVVWGSLLLAALALNIRGACAKLRQGRTDGPGAPPD